MTSVPPVPPVSTRSAVLSLLLGAHPPELTGREIVSAMGIFGISESTTRVALSRMVTAGDLAREDGVYGLSDRLVARQHAVEPPAVTSWPGTWEMAVVTTTGRSAPDRLALRKEMTRLRLAELREGVWLRPANLARSWTPGVAAVATHFEVRPDGDPIELAAQLWDLDAWRTRAREYLRALRATTDEADRFPVMVAAVRHLQTDPLLPAELTSEDWPGAELADVYAEYRAWLGDLRSRVT